MIRHFLRLQPAGRRGQVGLPKRTLMEKERDQRPAFDTRDLKLRA